MSNADFVHLHLHTEYSLLDAACRLDRLMDKAQAMGFPAVAMTDHGVMYGAVEFHQAAKKRGIRPILGCEVYVAPGSRLDKKPGAGMRDSYHHLVLLVNGIGARFHRLDHEGGDLATQPVHLGAQAFTNLVNRQARIMAVEKMGRFL